MNHVLADRAYNPAKGRNGDPGLKGGLALSLALTPEN